MESVILTESSNTEERVATRYRNPIDSRTRLKLFNSFTKGKVCETNLLS